jgi:putative membrane protein
MIPVTLRVVLTIGILLYYVVILYFLKKKALELKYTLLWLGAGVVMLLFIIFPSILVWLIQCLGVESPMNGLFFLVIAFLMMICMTLTSIVSRQTRKINRLVQQIAILENKMDKDGEMEKKV